MQSKVVTGIILFTFLAQGTLSFGQVSRFSSDKTKTRDPFEERVPFELPASTKNAQKCLEDPANSIGHGLSVITHIQELTEELGQSDFTSRKKIKEIYARNHCNLEVIDHISPEVKVNPLVGFSISKKKAVQPANELDATINACEVQRALDDAEGCSTVRTLQDAVDSGEVNAQVLTQVTQGRHASQANIAAAANVVGAIVSAISLYVSIQELALHKEEREEKRRESEQKDQKNEPPSRDQKSKDTRSDQSAESKPDDRSDKKMEKDRQPVTVEKITDREVNRPNEKPAVKEKDRPDFSTIDPQAENRRFDVFLGKLKENVKECDQRREAKKQGIDYSSLRDGSFVSTGPISDERTSQSKMCDALQLQEDLQEQKNKEFVCQGSSFECADLLDRQQRVESQKSQKLKAAYEACSVASEGEFKSETPSCKEIREALSGGFGGRTFDQPLNLESPFKKNSDKVKKELQEGKMPEMSYPKLPIKNQQSNKGSFTW